MPAHALATVSWGVMSTIFAVGVMSALHAISFDDFPVTTTFRK